MDFILLATHADQTLLRTSGGKNKPNVLMYNTHLYICLHNICRTFSVAFVDSQRFALGKSTVTSEKSIRFKFLRQGI